MARKQPQSVTVVFPYDQFSEVCDTLHMIAVVGADLSMSGSVPVNIQPDRKRLLAAFDTLAKAGFPKAPVPKEDDHK